MRPKLDELQAKSKWALKDHGTNVETNSGSRRRQNSCQRGKMTKLDDKRKREKSINASE